MATFGAESVAGYTIAIRIFLFTLLRTRLAGGRSIVFTNAITALQRLKSVLTVLEEQRAHLGARAHAQAARHAQACSAERAIHEAAGRGGARRVEGGRSGAGGTRRRRATPSPSSHARSVVA